MNLLNRRYFRIFIISSLIFHFWFFSKIWTSTKFVQQVDFKMNLTLYLYFFFFNFHQKQFFFRFRALTGAPGLLLELNCIKIHSSCLELCPLSRAKILNLDRFGVIIFWMVIDVFFFHIATQPAKGLTGPRSYC